MEIECNKRLDKDEANKKWLFIVEELQTLYEKKDYPGLKEALTQLLSIPGVHEEDRLKFTQNLLTPDFQQLILCIFKDFESKDDPFEVIRGLLLVLVNLFSKFPPNTAAFQTHLFSTTLSFMSIQSLFGLLLELYAHISQTPETNTHLLTILDQSAPNSVIHQIIQSQEPSYALSWIKIALILQRNFQSTETSLCNILPLLLGDVIKMLLLHIGYNSIIIIGIQFVEYAVHDNFPPYLQAVQIMILSGKLTHQDTRIPMLKVFMNFSYFKTRAKPFWRLIMSYLHVCLENDECNLGIYIAFILSNIVAEDEDSTDLVLQNSKMVSFMYDSLEQAKRPALMSEVLKTLIRTRYTTTAQSIFLKFKEVVEPLIKFPNGFVPGEAKQFLKRFHQCNALSI